MEKTSCITWKGLRYRMNQRLLLLKEFISILAICFIYCLSKPIAAQSAAVLKPLPSQEKVAVQNSYITIKHNKSQLYQGDKVTFTSKTSGIKQKDIVWSSSDKTVATVNQTGVVTAIKGGKTIIRAKDRVSGLTASLTIEVKYSVKQLNNMGFQVKAKEIDGKLRYMLMKYTGNKKKLEIPYGITDINYGVFINSNLNDIKLPETLISISDNAFSGCKYVESINLPDSVTTLGMEVFSDCIRLKGIKLPKKLSEISSSLFANCTSLVTLQLPKGVTTIGYRAFYHCSSLKEINLPNKLTRIEQDAFRDCISLSELVLPDSVTLIGISAFYNCCALESITISKNIKEIGNYAFKGTKSLSHITYNGDNSNIKVGYHIWDNSYYSEISIYCSDKHYFIYKNNIPIYEKVKSIIKELGIENEANQLEIIRKVHDWLVYQTSYSYKQFTKEYSKGRENVDVLLNDRFGICTAYADTFKLFMDVLGIECIVVSSDSMKHAWNMVKLDDDCWYHVDVTWDDPGEEESWFSGWIYYEYLIRNDEGIGKDHYGWQEDAPAADGTKYEDYFDHSYYQKIG